MGIPSEGLPQVLNQGSQRCGVALDADLEGDVLALVVVRQQWPWSRFKGTRAIESTEVTRCMFFGVPGQPGLSTQPRRP